VLVRVHRVSSIRDPDTGRYGKVIELVEERRVQSPPVRITGVPQESMIFHSMMQDLANYLQSLGLSMAGSLKPKMTLFLTEEEYEMLGVKLDVNEVYELEFKNGSITFKKAYD